MAFIARMAAGEHLPLPPEVRDALELRTGDTVLIRVEGRRAVLTRIPSLHEVAGVVPVPDEVRGASWAEIRRSAEHAVAHEAEARWRRSDDRIEP
jgi:bifunctional DNA-binding transcriptional regulator/antitoxin component of YhaV-PrlF toxin-antitoxin module